MGGTYGSPQPEVPPTPKIDFTILNQLIAKLYTYTAQMSQVVIGIDLGTTYSCVGYWEHGRVTIIANDQGNRTTPSYVSFDGETRLIGEGAKNVVAFNPTNTVYDAKRLIGRKFSDPVVQNDMKHWPFKVISRGGDKPMIEVQYQEQPKQFAPEEISAMVLTKMKETAEAYLGKPITGAVITVPAYFNDAQRNATRDAGIIAGINVMRIINEPTAAVIAYGLNKQTKDAEKNILIFDFGGGTHDVSVLTQAEGIFEIKATSGDTHLGGEDIDNLLSNYCLEDIKKRFNVNLDTHARARRRIQTACERAKRTLSSQTTTIIELESLFDGQDYTLDLSRSKFESLCMPIFRRTIDPIDDALRTARFDKTQIHEVILVGGSTRIPKVREMLSEYFNGKTLNMSVNPDEAVAYGAAVQAALLTGEKSEVLTDLVILDATPLTLGIETAGQIMTPMIPRGTTIPTKKTNIFSTYSDNQPACTICVYEGERKMTRDCNKLGEFSLSGIPPAPRGVPQIEITYDVDANSILNVTALEKTTGQTMSITIKNEAGHRSKEEIDQMIHEAEKFADEDKKQTDRIDAKNHLEGYIYQLKNSLPQINAKLTPENLNTIEATIKSMIEWLESHQQEPKETYEQRREEVEKVVTPIMMELYKSQGGAETPHSPPPSHQSAPNASQSERRGPKIEEID